MPHSKSSCQKTTYRRYRKGAFFFLFPVPYGNFLPLIRRQAALLPSEASPHIIECIDHFGESKRPTGFPIWSLLALLYPTVGAVAFHLATPAPPLAVAGGLLTNVGYVMLASAFLAGSFRVFGLRSRRATLVGCGIAIIGGFVSMNAAFSSFVG